jgi:uncharacterized protein (TIGR02757 family)
VIDFDALRKKLVGLEGTFDYEARIAADPVRFARRFPRREDREVAGLIASCFAYGSVGLIGNTLDRIFAVLGPSPAAFVMEWHEKPRPLFDGFYHRFNNGEDLLTLLWCIGEMKKRHGSLEELFLQGHRPPGLEQGLESFALAFLNASAHSPFKGTKGFAFFFPRPSGGSPCKRLCLYLRWMARRDRVDPGGWRGVSPADLIAPIDTHIQRIGRYLGFTARKNPSWKMAREITGGLCRLDPEDPLRFDFLLCHLGISGDCPRKRSHDKCRSCKIRDVCLAPAQKPHCAIV